MSHLCLVLCYSSYVMSADHHGLVLAIPCILSVPSYLSLSVPHTTGSTPYPLLLQLPTCFLHVLPCLPRSLSSLDVCHSCPFSSTASCTFSSHHHVSFSIPLPSVDCSGSFFASCIIFWYISVHVVVLSSVCGSPVTRLGNEPPPSSPVIIPDDPRDIEVRKHSKYTQ